MYESKTIWIFFGTRRPWGGVLYRCFGASEFCKRRFWAVSFDSGQLHCRYAPIQNTPSCQAPGVVRTSFGRFSTTHLALLFVAVPLLTLGIS